MINLHQCIVALIGRTANRVSYKTDGRGRWLASVPTLHSRRILPQPRYSGSYLGRNGCPLAVDRLHSRSLKGKDACWTAHFDLRLNADDVTAAPSGGFSRPKMLKENKERIAWVDDPTERMKHTGQAIRDAAEKGGYGYRWWKAND